MTRPTKLLLLWGGITTAAVVAAGVGLAFAVQRTRDTVAHLNDT
jgi:hypothetical protein